MAESLGFYSHPWELATVRILSHAAIQWASRAARANLNPRDDDGHSNLGWSAEHGALVSHPIDARARMQMGFSFRDGSLIWLQDGAVVDALVLAGHGEATAEGWCDELLRAAGLKPTELADMPYTLDPVNYEALGGAEPQLHTLGAWFSETQQALESLATTHGDDAIAPPAIRCWPHHYDLATLFVLGDGEQETATSIGIGVSPGDHFYDEPYLYCNPWPVPDGELPGAPEPMRWHTEGFTSLVCPASRMARPEDLPALVAESFAVVRSLLKA